MGEQIMPKRNGKIDAASSADLLKMIKAGVSECEANSGLVNMAYRSLMISPDQVEVESFNDTVRAAIQRHCDLLDRIHATGLVDTEGDGVCGAQVAKATSAADSLIKLAESKPIRKMPWWKRLLHIRDHVEQMRDSMMKLHDRATAMEEEGQELVDMFPQRKKSRCGMKTRR